MLPPAIKLVPVVDTVKDICWYSFFLPGVRPGRFIPLSVHGENDLNFGASGLGFIPDIAAVTPEDFPG